MNSHRQIPKDHFYTLLAKIGEFHYQGIRYIPTMLFWIRQIPQLYARILSYDILNFWPGLMVEEVPVSFPVYDSSGATTDCNAMIPKNYFSPVL